MSGRLAYTGGHGFPIHEVLRLACDEDRTWCKVQRVWDGANWSSPSFPFYVTIDTRRLRDYPFELPEADLTSQPRYGTISY